MEARESCSWLQMGRMKKSTEINRQKIMKSRRTDRLAMRKQPHEKGSKDENAVPRGEDSDCNSEFVLHQLR